MKAMMMVLALLCCSLSAEAADLYQWVAPETGKMMAAPTLPPYPIKEKQYGVTLPNGTIIKLILDENSPQYKAVIANKKAAEIEQKRLADERAAKEKRLADERAAQAEAKERLAEEQKIIAEKAANAKAVQEAERERIERERRIQRLAESEKREPTGIEIEDCLALLKKQYAFKDPESVRVEGEKTIIVYKDGERFLSLNVNAKNSYGAYAGAKQVFCMYKPNIAPEVISLDR